MTYVYEPAEDSVFLADVAEREFEQLSKIVDVGTGSGYIATRLQDAFDATVVGVDINRAACEYASTRGVQVVESNVTHAIQKDSVDLVVFNPPYLNELDDEETDVRLAHGDGGEAVDEFLSDAQRVLRECGRAVVLWSSRSPDELASYVRNQTADVEMLAEKRVFFEQLKVYSVSFE